MFASACCRSHWPQGSLRACSRPRIDLFRGARPAFMFTGCRFEHSSGQELAEDRGPSIVGGSEVRNAPPSAQPNPECRRRLAAAWAVPALRTIRTTASGPRPGRSDRESPARSARSRGVVPQTAPSRFPVRCGPAPCAAEAHGALSSRQPADPGARAEQPPSPPDPPPGEPPPPPWPKATPVSRRQSIPATAKTSFGSCGSTSARIAPLRGPSHIRSMPGEGAAVPSVQWASSQRRALPSPAGYVLRLRETRDKSQLHKPNSRPPGQPPQNSAYKSSLLPTDLLETYLERNKPVPHYSDFPPIRVRNNSGNSLLPKPE